MGPTKKQNAHNFACKNPFSTFFAPLESSAEWIELNGIEFDFQAGMNLIELGFELNWIKSIQFRHHPKTCRQEGFICFAPWGRFSKEKMCWKADNSKEKMSWSKSYGSFLSTGFSGGVWMELNWSNSIQTSLKMRFNDVLKESNNL